MFAFDAINMQESTDVLRTRTGASVTVRFAVPEDASALQLYFSGMSRQSRYSRFMGAVSEISPSELYRFTHVEAPQFPIVVTAPRDDGSDVIIGEGRYVVNAESGRAELALSISDAMRTRGIGKQLLANLECRAVAAGARYLFGDTLRTNDAMLGLARSLGYDFTATPGDWRQVRFQKQIISPNLDYPCASQRMALAQVMRARALRGS